MAQYQYSPVKIENHILMNGEKADCFIAYKIPLKNLVFIKKGESYFGGVTISFEAKSLTPNSELIIRDTKEIFINIDSYEDTKSDSEFLEGLSKLELDSGKYSILPTVGLLNTQRATKLKPFNIHVDFSKKINSPIVVEPISDSLGTKYQLVNYNGRIPHSLNAFSLLLLSSQDYEKLKIELYQNNKVIETFECESIGKSKYTLEKNDGKLYLNESDNGKEYYLFEVKNVNQKLFEGKVNIKILEYDNSNELDKFNYTVEWTDKPAFLRMEEDAVKILEIMADENEIDHILDKKELLKQRLYEFWKKYDSEKETAFNELMNEFYTRADYSFKNFSSLNNRNGAFTDRGKTYIKYGAPDKIERLYTKKNQTNEVWIYSKINKEFIFQDDDGLGNYNLLK